MINVSPQLIPRILVPYTQTDIVQVLSFNVYHIKKRKAFINDFHI